MLENYAKKVYEWCEENGYRLTGHTWFEFTHVRNIDDYGRNNFCRTFQISLTRNVFFAILNIERYRNDKN